MLADNLENILKVVGINDLPQEVVDTNKVYMDFPSDLFGLIYDGIQNVSFLNNAVRRVTKDSITCELRECVEGIWYRTKLVVFKGPSCRVTLEVVGMEESMEEGAFKVRGVG